MADDKTINLYIESPDGERFECDIPKDMSLSQVAAEFFEAQSWPTQDSHGRGSRAVVELVDPNNPDRTKRLREEPTVEDVGLWDGAILRISPESIAGGPMLDDGQPKTITWLHLSDLQFRETLEHDHNLVVDSLLQDVVKQARQGLKPDFIAITGDLAFSGKPEEYKVVAHFLDKLLEITEISKDRLFVVPGNHDVDLTETAQVNHALAEISAANATRAKFSGYIEFVHDYFGGSLDFSDGEYSYVRAFSHLGLHIAILGLNSDWMTQGYSADQGNLLLGEKQVWEALDRAVDADLKFALLHHPRNWLREFDRWDNDDKLLSTCDFVLLSHTHKRQETGRTLSVSQDTAIVIASGMGHESHSKPGSYNIVQLDLNAGKGHIHLRQYSDKRGGYENADSLSPNGLDEKMVFDLPRAGEILTILEQRSKIEELEIALTKAHRVVQILEERAAAYTVMNRPAQLQVELEDARKEVASLESQLTELTGRNQEDIFEGHQTLERSLELAKRVLAILEERAAGYTPLTFPVHLRLELEDKQREIADLEMRLKITETAATNSDVGRRWAVLVGVNSYIDPAIAPSQLAVEDVTALQRQLVAGGFNPDCVRVLTDDATSKYLLPTRANILNELSTVAEEAGEKDLLLFYFNGYCAVSDDESCLTVRDTQFSALQRTVISMRDLLKIIEKSSAHAKVIILDACYSGDFFDMALPTLIPDFLHDVFEDKGIIVLTSCQKDQVSYVWSEKNHSVFTYYLLEALAGNADFDAKGFITVRDVYRYISRSVRNWAFKAGHEQIPELQGRMIGDIILVHTTSQKKSAHSELLVRLSLSTQGALLWAEGLRQAVGATEIYTEYILAGLHQEVNELTHQLLTLFDDDMILQPKLRNLANEMTSTDLRLEDIEPASLETLQSLSLSVNAWESLTRAADLADKKIGLSFPAHFPISFDESPATIHSQHLLAGLLDTPGSVAAQWIAEILQVERETLYGLVVDVVDIPSLLDQVRRKSTRRFPSTESVWYLSASVSSFVNSKYVLTLLLSRGYPGSDSLLLKTSIGELTLCLQCEGFVIPEGEDVITFTLPQTAEDYQELSVELLPRVMGYHTITIEPFSVTHQYPPLSLTVDVRPTTTQERLVKPELPNPLGPRPIPQPDLVLRVYRQLLDDTCSCLEYILYSPHSKLHLTGIPLQSVEVTTGQLMGFRARLERMLRQSEGDELHAGLSALGRELYTLLFSWGDGGLAALYHEVADEVDACLILDDADSWIPWELVKPHGPDWEHDFLGARYFIGRWIEGWGVVRQAEYPLGQVGYVQESSMSQQAAEAWSRLVAAENLPRLGKDLFVDWPGGYPAAIDYASPVWGLHFEGYPDPLARRLETLALLSEEQLSVERIKNHWLDFRRKAPLVTFGQLRLDGRSALTEVETKWMPTFIRAGASAFVSAYWATDPQVDRFFWRAFYQATWQRKPLGEAVWQARQTARQAFPDSMDWLAYFLVGDPMAQGYIPRPGEGYTTLECINHDLERPLQIGKRYVFRATLRAAPPPWYHGRRYEAPEAAWEKPQLFVFAHGFTLQPGFLLPLEPASAEIRSVYFDMIPDRLGEHDIFAKFMDGDEVRHTLSFSVQVVAGEVA